MIKRLVATFIMIAMWAMLFVGSTLAAQGYAEVWQSLSNGFDVHATLDASQIVDLRHAHEEEK